VVASPWGSRFGSLPLTDHVEPVKLDVFFRQYDEYLTIGDFRLPLKAGGGGRINFGNADSISIENAILACSQWTFEVPLNPNVRLKVRLENKNLRLGNGEMEGEVEFPDHIAHVALMKSPCGGMIPHLTRTEAPRYTDEALRAKIEGEVLLRLRFDLSGQVSGANVVSGLGSGLDESAIEAVKHWDLRFTRTPPAGCEIVIKVQFKLP
jgi:TonB family protein